ncbi:MAG: hypothetical protein LC751_04035 [Actinobacteria bacterium]|nr:hypothetical protein [Actinomycetota bacterium]
MRHLDEAHDRPNDRPQTGSNGHPPPTDRRRPSSTAYRVSVPEAAEILGTTTDAVRSRMRRGKLRREEGEDGTVYVLLDDNVHDRPTTASDGRETGNPTVGNGRETVEDSLLAERMASEIDHLRVQLEEAHAANRENRRIIAALTQRIPEIEASRDSLGPERRDAPETAADSEPGNQASASDTGQSRRSWWRRFFGFE